MIDFGDNLDDARNSAMRLSDALDQNVLFLSDTGRYGKGEELATHYFVITAAQVTKLKPEQLKALAYETIKPRMREKSR